MQTQLPLFPPDTKLITPTLGLRCKDHLVYYLHNGSPIYCHKEEDKSGFRYICGNLVANQLCRASQLAKVVGVKPRNIERYAQAIREKGPEHFFHKKDERGQCHKMTQSVAEQAQELLDSGHSQLKTARKTGVSEGCIRYHLRKGTVKKKVNNFSHRIFI